MNLVIDLECIPQTYRESNIKSLSEEQSKDGVVTEIEIKCPENCKDCNGKKERKLKVVGLEEVPLTYYSAFNCENIFEIGKDKDGYYLRKSCYSCT